MKPLLAVAYVTMAVWLIVAAARRLAITLFTGQTPDWPTFASGAIGLAALLLILPAIDEWEHARRNRGDP